MYQALLDFWFSEQARPYWFKSTVAFDQQLVDAYADTWQQAKQGKLEAWEDTAAGSLALTIVLDQFPLNMFRGKPESFSTEEQSRGVARRAVEKAHDQGLDVGQRAFLYMPFMHSENLDDQALSVELYSRPGLEDNLRFARHHYAIVERFGRFPHRNKILGRESSAAEIEYLNSKQAFQG